MSLKTVLITRKIPDEGVKYLQSRGLKIIINESDSPISKSELLEKAKTVDAVISMLTDPIDKEFLTLNSHLKIVANYAVGLNNIDIETASSLGIYISHTPDVLTEATAEIALGLMINCARNFNVSHQAIVDNQFRSFDPLGFLGKSLFNKRLGIIGMGRIGQKLAFMCKNAFNMEIVYHNRKATNSNYQYLELNELLKTSDFISLNCPLNNETRNLISRPQFELMKKDVVLINTARGEVINQNDLYHFLKDNLKAQAGLDVTTPEPLPENHPLKTLTNCFILPHIGSAAIETRQKMSMMCAESIISVLENNPGLNIINREGIKPHP